MNNITMQSEKSFYPNQGTVSKEDSKITFEFILSAPCDEETMEHAKKDFLEIHKRLQTIVNRYIYFRMRSKVLKRKNYTYFPEGCSIVGKVLKRTGFIDES